VTRWWAPHALLPTGPATGVTFAVADGRFAAVTPGTAPGDASRLPGVALPGFANAHSHAFHRALRGRTHGGGGTFWTWREAMYAVAARLDPDSYLALARAAYAEMALAGITAVAEFHYVHHAPGGVPYADPHAMRHALRAAAADAGIRLTVLDTCYLAGGFDEPLAGPQLRFGDRDADAWAARAEGADGVAVHSVRAVPRDALAVVAKAAAGRPLHVHLSEQPAENAACLARHGLTPTGLLAAEGVLGPGTTAVHATHLTGDDVALLATSGTGVCLCPTTERDLADGIGPARALHDAGVALSLGSDQHAVIDPFEEVRGLEAHERLTSRERGRFTLDELLAAATRHATLGSRTGTAGPPVAPAAVAAHPLAAHSVAAHSLAAPPVAVPPAVVTAGQLAVGAPADLVAVRLDSVRTAGADPAQILHAATAADVDTVLVGGDPVVTDGVHRLGDVGRLLTDAIGRLR
jgi:formiminoglutamate deiminase